MEKRYDRIIGIDPDVNKSGVAELCVASRRMEVGCLTFPALMDYLQFIKQSFADDKGEEILVVVEAGWMNVNNWHTTHAQSIAAAAKTGQNTGRNHEVARKIAEMARHYGLEVEEVRPLRKCWKGKGGKITQAELEAFVGWFGRRMNQEARDAVLLAWTRARLPIRIVT